MFRSRRRALADRLRSRRRRAPKGDAVDDDGGVGALLDQFQRNQLEMLLAAIDGRGADSVGCVLVPRAGGGAAMPHVVCCREWRWADLGDDDGELRRLPTCPSACDPVYVCCNPYHWSRLCRTPDTPPPPYSRTNSDRIRPEDRAPSEAALLARDSYGSLTTNGESASQSPLEWCKLAYWEQERRVGPLYPVEPHAVNVFANVPYGHDGICLETLARSHCHDGAAANKTRSKIGLGITVSREERGCVWLYNRSDHPVFVNSVALDENPDSPQPTRVPPDYCVCVHDPEREAQGTWTPPRHFGPVDRNSVRISFVKGWGQNYSRREITSCPCWIEILLAPCR